MKTARIRWTPRPGRQAGMSLIEVMVGMLIGLIGIVIITHLYLANEQYKRSTQGAGTAQVNGAIALYTIERDTRMAGFGFNHSGALGCTCAGTNCSPIRYAYNGTFTYPPAGAYVASRPPLTLAPALITSTAGTPDSLTVLYSADAERALPGTLSEAMALTTTDFKVDGLAGYDVNNVLVLANGANCMLAQITSLTAASSTIGHSTGSLWNPAAGITAMPAATYVFNLGTPVWRTYAISGTTVGSYRLTMADVLGGIAGTSSTQAIMDDIVDMQLQYGKDTNTDNVVDAWNTTTPTTAAGWQEILAVRIGILARNANYEKPTVAGGACEATAAVPTWTGYTESAAAGDQFTIPGGVPSCYKYRVFETVIPLRNMIWRPL